MKVVYLERHSGIALTSVAYDGGFAVRFSPVVLALLWPTSIIAQNADGYLRPYQPNAYGPGINSDASGRPFRWETSPGDGPADPLSRVNPDGYGPGRGMDQYGRPVQPVPLTPRSGSSRGGGGLGDHFGAIAFSKNTGTLGYSYDYGSDGAAQQAALQSCGNDCAVVVSFINACGALAVGAGRGYGTGWAQSREEAESIALRYCASNTSECGISRWTCTSR
jgi:hypothetical protein